VIGYYHAVVPLRVERVTVRVPNLPASAEGTKIALMGDLHVGLFTRPSRLDRIFSTAASLDPDLVLVAGDLIDDDPYFVPKLLRGTRALPASTPLYAVLGNHEMYGNPRAVIERMRGSRMRLLVNEGVAHGDLWIAGLSDPAAQNAPLPDLDKALAGKPATSLPIVLSHQPRIIAESRKRAMPLQLSAHTHGGQFGIRPLGWSLAGVFLPYHMGLYDTGPTQLYINTGTGYWLVPFRLGMTPEITILSLTGSQSHSLTGARSHAPL
jgi:predicted MPP superfamily phosphohydrolase